MCVCVRVCVFMCACRHYLGICWLDQPRREDEERKRRGEDEERRRWGEEETRRGGKGGEEKGTCVTLLPAAVPTEINIFNQVQCHLCKYISLSICPWMRLDRPPPCPFSFNPSSSLPRYWYWYRHRYRGPVFSLGCEMKVTAWSEGFRVYVAR